MRFDSKHTVIARMPLFPPSVVREEPSFERRSISWVREHAGPVANAFVDALPKEFQNGDTRLECHLSYMKPGWRYRARGHWHTHGLDPGNSGRSKYDRTLQPAVVAIIGDVCLTRVCEGSFELSGDDRIAWDTELRQLIAQGAVREREVEEGTLVLYGFGDFHSSVQARTEGWRVILSAWHGPREREPLAPMNRVENVYSPQWPVSTEARAAFDPYRTTWPPHHPVPRSHESRVVLLNRVRELSSFELNGETPLFAAEPEFARQHGGPITRAVLEALPEDWRGSDGRVVVDSFLNWVFAGRVPGWDLFHFEPFPAQFEGARAEANWNEEEEHISCVFSDDAPLEFLVGQVEFEGDPAAQTEFWRFCTNLQRRHDALVRMVERGALEVQRVPAFTLHSHGWGDFFRVCPATRSGFHFRVRVSRATARPYCNARRNFDSADLVRF